MSQISVVQVMVAKALVMLLKMQQFVAAKVTTTIVFVVAVVVSVTMLTKI